MREITPRTVLLLKFLCEVCDMRLGQVMLNLDTAGRDLFFLENNEIEALLHNLAKQCKLIDFDEWAAVGKDC